MYSESAKQILEARLGFGKHSKEAIVVSASNEIGTSGRLISFFHPLAIIDNLYASVEDMDIDSDGFNAYLLQLKVDAVASSLTKVLHFHSLYDEAFDYSDMIIEKAPLFDEVIGNTLAISAIEQLISTSRINDEERSASFAYEKLKIELEGIVNKDGAVRSKGLNRKLRYSINKTARIFFPDPATISTKNVW